MDAVDSRLEGDGAWHVVLRPAEGGILTAAMTGALVAALHGIPEGSRFVLLTAEGPDFCAGRQSPTPPKGTVIGYSGLRARVADPVLEVYAVLRAVPLPVVMVVQGRALGVGCALAGLGDLVLADETARFGIPEMDKDIPPLLVMTALADRLPRAHLARLVLTREAVTAAEAVAMGLITHAVPAADMAEAVAGVRAKLAGNSRVVAATVKRFLNLGPELGFEARREYAATANPAAASERFLPG